MEQAGKPCDENRVILQLLLFFPVMVAGQRSVNHKIFLCVTFSTLHSAPSQ